MKIFLLPTQITVTVSTQGKMESIKSLGNKPIASFENFSSDTFLNSFETGGN